jgi:hypothetical protein
VLSLLPTADFFFETATQRVQGDFWRTNFGRRLLAEGLGILDPEIARLQVREHGSATNPTDPFAADYDTPSRPRALRPRPTIGRLRRNTSGLRTEAGRLLLLHLQSASTPQPVATWPTPWPDVWPDLTSEQIDSLDDADPGLYNTGTYRDDVDTFWRTTALGELLLAQGTHLLDLVHAETVETRAVVNAARERRLSIERFRLYRLAREYEAAEDEADQEHVLNQLDPAELLSPRSRRRSLLFAAVEEVEEESETDGEVESETDGEAESETDGEDEGDRAVVPTVQAAPWHRPLAADSECCICLETLPVAGPTGPLVACGGEHGCGNSVHAKCFTTWQNTFRGGKATCPICRQQLEPSCWEQ